MGDSEILILWWKQTDSSLAWSVVLSTTIFVISVKIYCILTRRTFWPLWWRLSLSPRVQTTLMSNLNLLFIFLIIITYSGIQWRETNLRIYNRSRSACSFVLARQSLTQVAWHYIYVEKTLGPTRLWSLFQSRTILVNLETILTEQDITYIAFFVGWLDLSLQFTQNDHTKNPLFGYGLISLLSHDMWCLLNLFTFV